MASETPYHNLGTYALGDDQWDHTDTVELVDSNVPEEDTLANRPADPPIGSLFWATDARILFRYEPTHDLAGSSGWVALGGMGASSDPIPGTAHLSNAAVTGDLAVNGQVSGDLAVAGDITEGGEPIATARSTKTIDVLDHGAASDADAALDAAETAAEPHDTLLFRDNTFVFTASHTLSKPLNFKFINAEIDDQRSNITVGEALFDFVAPGVQASDLLQADVGVGNHTITVGTAGFAAAGDTIYIEDTTGTEPITQFGVVDSVVDPGDGTQDITLEGVVRREFSANADVHIVEQWDNIRVEGAEITATHGDGELFTFEQCHRPRVEDVLAHEIGRHTVQFEECYDPSAVGCEARNAIKKGSGEGEPFICFRCTDVTFENCRAQSVRRGIDITLGTTGATIHEPHIEDFTKGGISAHDGDNVRDITVIGGEIASTDPSDNACISLAGLTKNISIYGTKLVAHRQAIYITGRADIQGVQIELAELPSADPELISVAGDNVSIQGSVHIPTYENYVRIADVRSGVSSVDLDLDVDIDAYNAGGNDNPLLQVSSGASDVTIRGTINSLADLSQPAIRLYGQTAMVENVDIEATIRGHGYQGVQLRGDAGVRTLRVSDSVIDVDGDCIRFHQFDTGTTIERIWVRDCELTSTNGNGLDAGGMAADTIYFLDNIGSIVNTASATNVHKARAELDKDETVTGAWDFANGVTTQSAHADKLYNDDRDPDIIVRRDSDGTILAVGDDGLVASGDDAATVIQAAIDSLDDARNTKGVISVKGGAYKIYSKISLDSFLHLNLRGVNLKAGAGFPDNTPMLEGLQVQQLSIEGGMLDGDRGGDAAATVNHKGLYITADENPDFKLLEAWNTFRDVHTTRFESEGFYAADRRGRYIGCVARNNNGSGWIIDHSDILLMDCVGLNNDQGFNIQGDHHVLLRCIGQNNAGYQVFINDTARYNRIKYGFYELGRGPGIRVDSTSSWNQIEGTEIIANTGEAIILGSDKNQVIGNDIYDNQSTTSQTDAVKVETGATDNILKRNNIEDNPVGITDNGARTQINDTIELSAAPTASNYTQEDAGVEILDVSVSPPSVYRVLQDGSVAGPL